jgi:hypothetical protein
MYTSCLIGISIQISTSLCRFYKQFLTALFGIFFKPDSQQKYLQVEQRQLSQGFIFHNLSVQRSFLQYKSKCLEKVNVKYVIKRLWHEIFHIDPGINPRHISALQLRCRACYGSLGLIPGPIWKISCNNLLLSKFLSENMATLQYFIKLENTKDCSFAANVFNIT